MMGIMAFSMTFFCFCFSSCIIQASQAAGTGTGARQSWQRVHPVPFMHPLLHLICQFQVDMSEHVASIEYVTGEVEQLQLEELAHSKDMRIIPG